MFVKCFNFSIQGNISIKYSCFDSNKGNVAYDKLTSLTNVANITQSTYIFNSADTIVMNSQNFNKFYNINSTANCGISFLIISGKAYFMFTNVFDYPFNSLFYIEHSTVQIGSSSFGVKTEYYFEMQFCEISIDDCNFNHSEKFDSGTNYLLTVSNSYIGNLSSLRQVTTINLLGTETEIRAIFGVATGKCYGGVIIRPPAARSCPVIKPLALIRRGAMRGFSLLLYLEMLKDPYKIRSWKFPV